jgi:hypothetical protein
LPKQVTNKRELTDMFQLDWGLVDGRKLSFVVDDC